MQSVNCVTIYLLSESFSSVFDALKEK